MILLIRKYLIPRQGQLSVSLVALLSLFVISLVVWLVLTFLSVIGGIEKRWLHKLTMLHAPIRITPTEAYYNSYYYNIDAIAQVSGYETKSLKEKNESPYLDPYNPDVDEMIPDFWPAPPGKDLVKTLTQLLQNIPGLKYDFFEVAGTLLRLQLVRPGEKESFLSQMAYIAPFSVDNPYLKALLKPEEGQKAPLALTMHGVYLPKGFRDSGVRIGDRGTISYSSRFHSQDDTIPIEVMGFYDPGVLAIGNKCLFMDPKTVGVLAKTTRYHSLDPEMTEAVQVWIKDFAKVASVKKEIIAAIDAMGLSPYFRVKSFREYTFAKELLEQFESDKMLLALIGTIILLVACSNIISFLVVLTQTKRKEIGMLKALGATNGQIAWLFGSCGAFLGSVGSLIGTVAAFFTLRYIGTIANFLGTLLGHEAFHTAFYGESLPTQLDSHALFFLWILTPVLSLTAALIPARRACAINPSVILRSEG